MSSVDIQPAKPPDSDPFGNKHPAKQFKAEAETRNSSKGASGDDHLSLNYSPGERTLNLMAKGPWALGALAVIAIAFAAMVFLMKGR